MWPAYIRQRKKAAKQHGRTGGSTSHPAQPHSIINGLAASTGSGDASRMAPWPNGDTPSTYSLSTSSRESCSSGVSISFTITSWPCTKYVRELPQCGHVLPCATVSYVFLQSSQYVTAGISSTLSSTGSCCLPSARHPQDSAEPRPIPRRVAASPKTRAKSRCRGTRPRPS